jgi:hypothetical protein
LTCGFFVAVLKPKTTGSSDEKGPDSSDNVNKTRGGWPKGKKRKKAQRDQTAPRQPLTGMQVSHRGGMKVVLDLYWQKLYILPLHFRLCEILE